MDLAETTLLTQARNGTAAEFAFSYTNRCELQPDLRLHEFYLVLAKMPTEGPGGIEAAFDFHAAYNAVAGCMMTVALKNQQAGTEYA